MSHETDGKIKCARCGVSTSGFSWIGDDKVCLPCLKKAIGHFERVAGNPSTGRKMREINRVDMYQSDATRRWTSYERTAFSWGVLTGGCVIAVALALIIIVGRII